jgi:hypothetical protein
MQVQPTPYNIGDLNEWYRKETLILQPKFQRRLVWSPKARSYLLDTIVRGLPVPKLYIRQQIDLTTKRAIREVVDGQQRLRAVFDFIDGTLVISKIHNQEYGGIKFEKFPDEEKRRFLAYQFSVDTLLGASDREVLDIFTRINSYTLTLKAQERRNAKFQGVFKQTVYGLGWDHLEFWRNNSILTDQRIARMGEAELTSELVVAMLYGLQEGKESLDAYYKQYEDQFPEKEMVIKRFHEMIDLIAFVFGDKLFTTPFRREPFFYSLFCVFYDCTYGLPGMKLGRIEISKKTRGAILEALVKLGIEMIAEEPKSQYVELRAAVVRSTDKLRERTTRHHYISNAMKSAVSP